MGGQPVEEIPAKYERFRSYEPRLIEFGFECLGLLGNISTPPYDRGLYAFVALKAIADDNGGTSLTDDYYRAPNEVFYVGRTTRLPDRLKDYDRAIRDFAARSRNRGFAPKQVPIDLARRLLAARRQAVEIAVYARHIGRRPKLVDGLPVDLLHGGEEGLFAVLLPLCNPMNRWWTYAEPLDIEACFETGVTPK
jgi:hypothetical protein